MLKMYFNVNECNLLAYVDYKPYICISKLKKY
uniref:Uncharacterized protein n=1 Tax=Myoviridae sp. ctNQV2 TaxID=2827683 RepID=A0A8S5RZ54_9CAUD|nr:MAG TPA: hypothetical protein [Myoviridae sp. ctNQV2]